MSAFSAACSIALLFAQQREAAVALVHDVEAATADFATFKAGVTVDRVDALTEERERRMGRVIVESKEPAGNRRFALILETTIGPDGTADESRRHFVYDAGWLAERDDERKQFVKRQIVAPGESFDPLRVGEGPLPLPIGQRAEDVLSSFEVLPATKPERGLLSGLERVRGARLVPRVGHEELEETVWIDLFYDASSLLPVGVVQRKRSGDSVEVLLRSPTLSRTGDGGAGLDDADRALLSIESPDRVDGWAIDIRPWKSAREPMNDK